MLLQETKLTLHKDNTNFKQSCHGLLSQSSSTVCGFIRIRPDLDIFLCSEYSSVTLKCEYIHKITHPSDLILLLNVYYQFNILRISLLQCF